MLCCKDWDKKRNKYELVATLEHSDRRFYLYGNEKKNVCKVRFPAVLCS